jgi:hypothetical protein
MSLSPSTDFGIPSRNGRRDTFPDIISDPSLAVLKDFMSTFKGESIVTHDVRGMTATGNANGVQLDAFEARGMRCQMSGASMSPCKCKPTPSSDRPIDNSTRSTFPEVDAVFDEPVEGSSAFAKPVPTSTHDYPAWFVEEMENLVPNIDFDAFSPELKKECKKIVHILGDDALKSLPGSIRASTRRRVFKKWFMKLTGASQ